MYLATILGLISLSLSLAQEGPKKDLINKYIDYLRTANSEGLAEIIAEDFEIDRCGIDKISRAKFLTSISKLDKSRERPIREFEFLKTSGEVRLNVDDGLTINSFKFTEDLKKINGEIIDHCDDEIPIHTSLINEALEIATNLIYIPKIHDDIKVVQCGEEVIKQFNLIRKIPIDDFNRIKINDEELQRDGSVSFKLDLLDEDLTKVMTSINYKIAPNQRVIFEEQWLSCDADFYPNLRAEDLEYDKKNLEIHCGDVQYHIDPKQYFRLFNNAQLEFKSACTRGPEKYWIGGCPYGWSHDIGRNRKIISSRRCFEDKDLEIYRDSISDSLQDLLDLFVDAINQKNQTLYQEIATFPYPSLGYPKDMPKLIIRDGNLVENNLNVTFHAIAEFTNLEYSARRLDGKLVLIKEKRKDGWVRKYEAEWEKLNID